MKLYMWWNGAIDEIVRGTGMYITCVMRSAYTKCTFDSKMATHFFKLYVIWVLIVEYLGIICIIENYYAGVENMGGRR